MTLHRMSLGIVALSCVLLVGFASLAVAGSIEGRWTLTEQYYGEGDSNLISATDEPLYLEFVRDAAGLHGWIWRGTDRSGAQMWPTLIGAAGAGPAAVERLDLAADESEVSTSYTAAPSATDDLLLRVVEQYILDDDGKALAGRVEITFERDGVSKGSYVLRRRFERQP